MKAGILSDTHDRAKAARGALAVFRAEEVEVILHLGDVCSPKILAGFLESGIPLMGVFGNNDMDRAGLAEATDGAFREGPVIERIGGRKVLMAHTYGDLKPHLDRGGGFDLILFGHTHKPATMRVRQALVLNPGASAELFGKKGTCAVVDLETMEARILEVPSGEAE